MKPLDGIKVVEMTSWMAAPSAGAILADLGADVIKVEPPRGDPLRGISRQPKVPEGEPTIDAAFNVDNRGKRSIAVSVDQPAGADLVKRLIADADVLLTNLLAHRQTRYGFDPDSLREVNTGLVHATLTGYGLDGPDAPRPGYDVTAFFGRGGVTQTVTAPGGSPPRAPTARATTRPVWRWWRRSWPPCDWRNRPVRCRWSMSTSWPRPSGRWQPISPPRWSTVARCGPGVDATS